MQRTVQNAVTHNEGDTVWNSFMRCRLLNYFVHGTIPQFICIFLSLVSDSFVLLRFIFNPDLLFL